MTWATAGQLTREALRLATAFLVCAVVTALVLGLLSWSFGVMALAFGTTLAITALAGLPTYLVFRLFGPIGLWRAMLAGAVAALLPIPAVIAYDRTFHPDPMDLSLWGTLVGSLVIAGLGASAGAGIFLAYRVWGQQPQPALN